MLVLVGRTAFSVTGPLGMPLGSHSMLQGASNAIPIGTSSTKNSTTEIGDPVPGLGVGEAVLGAPDVVRAGSAEFC